MTLHLKPSTCLLELTGVKIDKTLADNPALTVARTKVKQKQKETATATASGQDWSLELDDALEYYNSLIEISQVKGLSSKAKLQVEKAKLAVMEALFSEFIGDEPLQPKAPKSNRMAFRVLCGLGLFFAVAEGADGIASVLTAAIANPPMILLALSAGFFALINIIIYFGFEMTEISHALGVSLFDFASVMNTYYLQEMLLEKFYEKLIAQADSLATHTHPDLRDKERKRLKSYAQIAKLAKKDLDSKISVFMEEHKPTTAQKVAKTAFGALGGTLFALDGFFVLKSFFAIFAAGFVASTAGFWITLGAAVVVGMGMNLAAYWCMERVGTMNLLDKFAGRPAERQSSLTTARERTDGLMRQLDNKLELDARRLQDDTLQLSLRDDLSDLSAKRSRLNKKIELGNQAVSDRLIVPSLDYWQARRKLNHSEARCDAQLTAVSQAEQQGPSKTKTLLAAKERLRSVVRHQKAVKGQQSDALALSKRGIFKMPSTISANNHDSTCQARRVSV